MGNITGNNNSKHTQHQFSQLGANWEIAAKSILLCSINFQNYILDYCITFNHSGSPGLQSILDFCEHIITWAFTVELHKVKSNNFTHICNVIKSSNNAEPIEIETFTNFFERNLKKSDYIILYIQYHIIIHIVYVYQFICSNRHNFHCCFI